MLAICASNVGFSHSDLVAGETIGVLVDFRQPAYVELPGSKFKSFGEWIELACVVVFFAFLTGLEVRVLLRSGPTAAKWRSGRDAASGWRSPEPAERALPVRIFGCVSVSGSRAPAVRAHRHVRPRSGEEQATTPIELFFDLVYVLAITQLSQLLLSELSWVSLWHAAFLLLVTWWAWINTTWMTNWLDPQSAPIRLLVVAGALLSLLMAAAVPDAFGSEAMLFVAAYVSLQVGRNLSGAVLLRGDHPLGETFGRLTAWSVAAGVLWFAGALVPDSHRLALWAPALAVELAAPAMSYWVPGRGRLRDAGHPIDGAHFADRSRASSSSRSASRLSSSVPTPPPPSCRRWLSAPSHSRSARSRRCGGCTSARSRSAPATR